MGVSLVAVEELRHPAIERHVVPIIPVRDGEPQDAPSRVLCEVTQLDGVIEPVPRGAWTSITTVT